MTDALSNRITAAARTTGHAVDALMGHLSDVIKPLVGVVVHTNSDVDSIGVSVAVPDDQWLARRMANLANAISASPALARVAIARKGQLRAERGIGPKGRPAPGISGVFSTLTIEGPATLGSDLGAADAAGVPAAVRELLAGRLRALSGDDDGARDRIVRTIVYSGPGDQHTTVELGAAAADDLVVRLSATAETFGLTGDDLTLLRVLHPALAEVATPTIRVAATTAAIVPGFTVSYTNVPVDDALALAGKFSDAGVQRLQEFLAALGSQTIASLDLSFGPRELGPLWLGIRV